MTEKTGEPRFEELLQRLEEVVKELEGGDLPLETSLKRFEEGVALARVGTHMLDEAERRVEVLLAETEGEPLLTPFDGGATGSST